MHYFDPPSWSADCIAKQHVYIDESGSRYQLWDFRNNDALAFNADDWEFEAALAAVGGDVILEQAKDLYGFNVAFADRYSLHTLGLALDLLMGFEGAEYARNHWHLSSCTVFDMENSAPGGRSSIGRSMCVSTRLRSEAGLPGCSAAFGLYLLSYMFTWTETCIPAYTA